MATKTYRPFEARRLSERKLRSEYSRLRRLANKRLENLEKNNLGTWGSRRFASARGMSAEYVEAALLEVSHYLRDVRHTVKGEREFRDSVLQTLHDKYHYYFINESNFYEFAKFMEDKQDKYSEKVYDSSDAAQVFNNAARLKINADMLEENFDYFAKNAHKLEQMKLLRKDQRISFDDLKKRIEKIK